MKSFSYHQRLPATDLSGQVNSFIQLLLVKCLMKLKPIVTVLFCHCVLKNLSSELSTTLSIKSMGPGSRIREKVIPE